MNIDGVSSERYKLVKEVKKDGRNAKAEIYKEMYKKLGAKDAEKDMYRIARIKKKA